jgi:ATP-dependent Clp protease adaptor protein ClpS
MAAEPWRRRRGFDADARTMTVASGLIAISKRLGAPHVAQRPFPVFAAREPRKAGDNGRGSSTAVITRTRTAITVLQKYFHKGADDATRIMLHVHQNGVGECGVYTYEVAETKVTQVMDYARKHQHPLQCIMEKK